MLPKLAQETPLRTMLLGRLERAAPLESCKVEFMGVWDDKGIVNTLSAPRAP